MFSKRALKSSHYQLEKVIFHSDRPDQFICVQVVQTKADKRQAWTHGNHHAVVWRFDNMQRISHKGDRRFVMILSISAFQFNPSSKAFSQMSLCLFPVYNVQPDLWVTLVLRLLPFQSEEMSLSVVIILSFSFSSGDALCVSVRSKGKSSGAPFYSRYYLISSIISLSSSCFTCFARSKGGKQAWWYIELIYDKLHFRSVQQTCHCGVRRDCFDCGNFRICVLHRVWFKYEVVWTIQLRDCDMKSTVDQSWC